MKKTLNGIMAILAVGLVSFLGGCGPQNLSDADYLAQLSEAGLAKDGDDMQDQGDQEGNDAQGQDDNAPASSVSSSSVPAPMPQPVMVRKLPPRHLRAPTVVERQAPIVLETSEQRDVEQDIHHWKTILRPQATITNHRIHNVLNRKHIYHTNIVNHPTTCTKVFHTSQVLETQEVTPTVEQTAPVRVGCPGIVGGCPGRLIPGAAGYPYGYGYGLGYGRFGRRW